MGLLDDAIRDHLDLKRRRGADPAEVERAEREALGPVRRGGEPVQEAGYAPDEAAAHDSEVAADHGYAPAEEPAWSEPAEYTASTAEPGPLTFESQDSVAPAPLEPSEAAAPPPAVAPPTAPPPTAVDPPAPAPAPPPPAAASPEPAAPHESDVPPPGAPEPDGPGGETVEYDMEHALDHEPVEGDPDDVLEETPEFLQDTPDHDRLWFEQRPPRDFDFDG